MAACGESEVSACGTVGGYTNHRCRCAACREAMRLYISKRRKRYAQLLRSGLVSVPHGNEHTYCNYRCRCDECTEAWRLACQERTIRRKAGHVGRGK